MCGSDEGFTTVTGPREGVGWLVDNWEHLRLPSGRRLWELDASLRYSDLAEVDDAYGRPGCGAVATVFHRVGDGARMAGLLGAVLRNHTAALPARLLCEPGHRFRIAAPGGGTGGPAGSPLLDSTAVTAALPHVPARTRGSSTGSRVALLDTGDANSRNPMIDLTRGVVTTGVTAADPHGHGTAVAEAVAAVTPHADVHAVQVFDAQGTAASASMYQGLILALWDAAGYDVVNASFTIDAQTDCGTSLAATFTYLMQLRAGTGSGSPRLVAAAGNDLTGLEAPATADGATVVTALDLKGRPVPYCAQLKLPTGVVAEQAPGGTDTDPLGWYPNGDPIFGTSFAAGFVTGVLAA